MISTCPRCSYVRKPADTAPEYACPECGVVYEKYLAAQRARAKQAEQPATAAPLTFKEAWKQSNKQPMSAGGIIAAVVAVFVVQSYIFGSGGDVKPSRDAVTNSGWDGSVHQVERYLKDRLRDPASFEAIEWSTVVKRPDGYAVRLKYRARNAFGGYVVEHQIFEMNSSGHVISVRDTGQ
jgi:predicted RNA-binding Zn-ribbon protein involved in translation (DUF1610 family)